MTHPFTTLITSQLETRTKTAGQSVSSTANTLRSIAARLREDGSSKGVADIADRGADLMVRVGSYLEESDFHALISDAEDFSRERPWAVASLGLAGGLLVSRLLKSTAARRAALAQTASSPAPIGADDAPARARPAKKSRRRTRGKAVPADGI